MRSPSLDLITLSLISQIRIAATPGVKAPVYRPATAAAVRLTRQAVREVIAAKWREHMQRIAANAQPVRVSTGPDTFRTANRFSPNWRG